MIDEEEMRNEEQDLSGEIPPQMRITKMYKDAVNDGCLSESRRQEALNACNQASYRSSLSH